MRRARSREQCDAVVATAVERLGGLDAVVYATAVDPLVRLVDTDLERWRQVYETNVFGASLVTRAALAPLTASGGRMVYISATSVGRPLPGMGAYETSKAALDELVRAWRGEHPEIGFCNVAVGNTLGTEVHESWDRDLLIELAPVWEARGYVHDNGPGAMSVPDCATAVRGRDHVAGEPALRRRQPGSGFHHGRGLTWRDTEPVPESLAPLQGWLEAHVPRPRRSSCSACARRAAGSRPTPRWSTSR